MADKISSLSVSFVSNEEKSFITLTPDVGDDSDVIVVDEGIRQDCPKQGAVGREDQPKVWDFVKHVQEAQRH